MKNQLLNILLNLQYIKRYSTHRVNYPQSVAAHSHVVTCLAAIIAECENARREENEEKLDMLAIYSKATWHDVPEAMLGDIPAPTKHFDDEMRNKIGEIEKKLFDEALLHLPREAKKNIRRATLNCKDGTEGEIIALADLLERLIYLTEERRSGNTKFNKVYENTIKQLNDKYYGPLVEKYPMARTIMDYFLNEWDQEGDYESVDPGPQDK